MRFQTADFTIDIDDGRGRAVLVGVMRLPSPSAYEEGFGAIRREMEASAVYVLDIGGVAFMNSSGISALSRLVLVARDRSTDLSIVGREEVAWQRKTIGSLKRLYERLDVRLG